MTKVIELPSSGLYAKLKNRFIYVRCTVYENRGIYIVTKINYSNQRCSGSAKSTKRKVCWI